MAKLMRQCTSSSRRLLNTATTHCVQQNARAMTRPPTGQGIDIALRLEDVLPDDNPPALETLFNIQEGSVPFEFQQLPKYQRGRMAQLVRPLSRGIIR